MASSAGDRVSVAITAVSSRIREVAAAMAATSEKTSVFAFSPTWMPVSPRRSDATARSRSAVGA